ncbi:hypothetical protein GQ43DRAFT_40672 [Delitschia confertaspora ATCC 74209]|uniref:Uncharacterized protein n=1 Tax=Delitschia confertaspora ATCC 74209 TaxID=1513339 RepID=A0A9P4MYW6_9PLEO|nr:hypothetical protein GQ43DRAFT_40672 [Delitschia confertaspora ATCC 74209]
MIFGGCFGVLRVAGNFWAGCDVEGGVVGFRMLESLNWQGPGEYQMKESFSVISPSAYNLLRTLLPIHGGSVTTPLRQLVQFLKQIWAAMTIFIAAVYNQLSSYSVYRLRQQCTAYERANSNDNDIPRYTSHQ